MKKNRIIAFVLAITTCMSLLSGCNASITMPEYSMTESYAETSKAEQSEGSKDDSSVSSEAVNSSAESQSQNSGTSDDDTSEIDDLRQQIDDLNAEIEKLRGMLTLPTDTMINEGTSLSADKERELDELLNTSDHNVLAGTTPLASTTLIKQRDWDKYASKIAKSKLTHSEKVLYERLDDVCRRFLTDSSASIKKNGGRYYLGSVEFDDLKLSKSKASDVMHWFKYNNPQYYFLSNCYSYTQKTIYLHAFDFVAGLKDFPATTNKLFDKLDGWIASCSDDEKTTWQRLNSINKVICEAIIYDPVVSNRDKKYSKEQANAAAGEENQSMYSVLMTPETVCAGYAQTFTAMTNYLGIDSVTALSSTHAWNTIKFDDGNYYYIDACWNDQDKGYTTKWLGVGSLFANDSSHIYESSTASIWAPEIAQNNYIATSKDKGGSTTKTLTTPSLKIAGNSNYATKISWNKVANADEYQVKAYCGGICIMNVNTKETAQYIPYTADAKNMQVTVRAAFTENNNTTYSQWAEIAVDRKASATKVSAPSNLKSGTTAKNGLALDWTNSTNHSFIVSYGSDSNFTKAAFAYELKNHIGWTTWNPTEKTYFRIFAATTTASESISEPLSFSYSKSEGVKLINEVNTQTIAAPTNLKLSLVPATSTEARKIKATWTEAKLIDGYEFQMSRKADFSTITGSKTLKNTTNTLNITNISETSVHYYIRLRSYTGSGTDTKYSKWVVADLLVGNNTAAVVTKPANPTNLKGNESGTTEILTWDAVKDATGYVITYYSDAQRTKAVKEMNTTNTTVRFTNCTPGKTYYYKIRTVKSSNGTDLYSDGINFNFAFKGNTPEAPKNMTAEKSGDNNVLFKWDAVSSATSYVITLYKDSTRKTISKEFKPTKNSVIIGPFSTGKYYFSIRSVSTKNGKDYYSEYYNFILNKK